MNENFANYIVSPRPMLSKSRGFSIGNLPRATCRSGKSRSSIAGSLPRYSSPAKSDSFAEVPQGI
jgi:hypothetical protein